MDQALTLIEVIELALLRCRAQMASACGFGTVRVFPLVQVSFGGLIEENENSEAPPAEKLFPSPVARLVLFTQQNKSFDSFTTNRSRTKIRI